MHPPTGPIHQHPLAYLLGLEGAALMRAFTGEYDRDFVEARLAEVRALLDAAEELGTGAAAEPITSADGYRSWAPFYDRPGNRLVDVEQPIVRRILDGLPVGTALDAACGTGRHSAHLAALGHAVIGVDSSPDMLALARARVPGGRFHEADLHHLPVPDDHVDVLVCALALAHVPDLGPVLAEFTRVLRPGGHLVLSDTRGLLGHRGYPLVQAGPGGAPGYIPSWVHATSDYLAAALPLGLQVRSCEEPRRTAPYVDEHGVPPTATGPAPALVPGTPPSIWALHPWCVAAANAAYRDTPAAVIWHFQLSRPASAGR